MLINSYNIQIGNCSFPYYLGLDCTDIILQKLNELKADKLIIIADQVVSVLYNELITTISRDIPCHLLTYRVCEMKKNLHTVHTFIEKAFRHKITRRSVVVGFGGGITGNIAGLVSALLFRGIRLIHIPTTLMAMSDSVISLKQGVNATVGKNLIGAFYCPEFVITDLNFLGTLDPAHIRSGICEAIKNILCIQPEKTDYFTSLLKGDTHYTWDEFYHIIDFAISSKMKVLKNDIHEKKDALVLEYGHSLGHAIELISRKGITHGEAVGVGMIFSGIISRKLGFLSPSSLNLHYALLKKIQAPLKIPQDCMPDAILQKLRFDNKRGYLKPGNDTIPLILLEELGKPVIRDNYCLIAVDNNIIQETIQELCDADNDLSCFQNYESGGNNAFTAERKQ